jgi:endo-1,4-beta-xylanase
MGHVYDHENGNVLYSWDVVNEYVHAENSGWEAVYGNEGLTPGFVKKAYMIADDVLRQYGVRENVSLLYNDFNTYSAVAQILKLLAFINEDGAQSYCDGVGMQSHVSPPSNPPVIKYRMALEDFLEAGYEVHITELDVQTKIQMYQDTYYYDLMKALLEVKQAGGELHGITLWGLADMYSWKKENKPLLYTTLTMPKSSYYKVLEAYVDMGLSTEE